MTIDQHLYILAERRIGAWVKIYERLREAKAPKKDDPLEDLSPRTTADWETNAVDF